MTLELQDPSRETLIDIARKHHPKGDEKRIGKIAEKMEAFRANAADLRRRPPGTSEFLDAIRACEELKIEVSDADDSVWKKIENALLVKGTRA